MQHGPPGVSWCRSTEGPLLLASCGEDGKVRVWNVDDFVLVLEHSVHQVQGGSRISFLFQKKSSPNLKEYAYRLCETH